MKKCQRCKKIGEDRRTLWMACFYAMDELWLPFKKIESSDKGMFYTLTVCKNCRASWMEAIKDWFNKGEVKEIVNSGIFVRRNGATIEISEQEWYRENPGRDPVRVKL